jgi:hypothetical protein
VAVVFVSMNKPLDPHLPIPIYWEDPKAINMEATCEGGGNCLKHPRAILN